MRDFGETSDELAKSRKHLLQAERMAMVGLLAAGVANTIKGAEFIFLLLTGGYGHE